MLWRYITAFLLSLAVIAIFMRRDENQQPKPAPAGGAQPNVGAGAQPNVGAGAQPNVGGQPNVGPGGKPAGGDDAGGGNPTENGNAGTTPPDTGPTGDGAPAVGAKSSVSPGVDVAWIDDQARASSVTVAGLELMRGSQDVGPFSLSIRDSADAEWQSVGPFVRDAAAKYPSFTATQGDLQFAIAFPPVTTRPFAIGARLRVTTSSEQSRQFEYRLTGATGVSSTRRGALPVDRADSDHRLAWGVPLDSGYDVQTRSFDQAIPAGADVEKLPGARWISVVAATHIVALVPRVASDGSSGFIVAAEAAKEEFVDGFGGLSTSLVSAPQTAGPGQSIEHSFDLYVGPRSPANLRVYSGYGLQRANLVDVLLSERFRAVFDTGDGRLHGLYLRDFDRDTEQEGARKDYQVLYNPLRGSGTLSLDVQEEQLTAEGVRQRSIGFDKNPWVLSGVQDGKISSSVLLERRSNGLRVRKLISLPDANDTLGRDREGGPVHLRVVVEVENIADAEKRVNYHLFGPSAIDSEHIRSPGYDLICGFGAHTARGMAQEIRDTAELSAETQWDRAEGLAWVGVANSYFGASLFPRTQADGGRAAFIDFGFCQRVPDPNAIALAAEEIGRSVDRLPQAQYNEFAEAAFANVRTGLVSIDSPLAAGSRLTHEYGLWVGTRQPNDLEPYAALGLEGLNDYGSLGALVSLFIGFLEILSFGGWGLAIILLTFGVKLCLHPINRKVQRSMMRSQKKMAKVKPLLDEIKVKYEKDKLKQNQEMQRIFRENGVNPAQQLGGCLMIFLQLPIWIGLYRTLEMAIGLRQAEFLYIVDLTQPDRLHTFETPLLGFLTYINILPVFYVILTLVNQRLQPKPEDPQMQANYRMMSFMMIFFGFIFYSFPSGFMLYIMTSAALGIVESKMIKAQLAKEDEAAEVLAPAAAYPASGGAQSPAYSSNKKSGKNKKNKKRK